MSDTTKLDPNKPVAMTVLGEIKSLIDNALDERLELLSQPANDDLLDRAGAAKYLGVSLPQVDKFCREKDLPFHRVGDVKRFDREEVRAWVREQGK
ncbi:MAG: helix-turn-helix domain-containing protein [Polyangiaceae bacterium]